MNCRKYFYSLVTLAIGVLSLAGCASNNQTRQQLQQIHAASVNNNVDFRGSESGEERQIRPLEQSLIDSFVQGVNRAGIFPQPVVTVRASLQTWREEVGEMQYDAQFKLKVRQGMKEGVWVVEALLQSRAGSIIWRAAKTVKARGELDEPSMKSACQALVNDLKRARR